MGVPKHPPVLGIYCRYYVLYSTNLQNQPRSAVCVCTRLSSHRARGVCSACASPAPWSRAEGPLPRWSPNSSTGQSHCSPCCARSCSSSASGGTAQRWPRLEKLPRSSTSAGSCGCSGQLLAAGKASSPNVPSSGPRLAAAPEDGLWWCWLWTLQNADKLTCFNRRGSSLHLQGTVKLERSPVAVGAGDANEAANEDGLGDDLLEKLPG